MPHKVRRKHLHDKWAFECNCTLCSASAEDAAAHDERRMRIVKLRQQLRGLRGKREHVRARLAANEYVKLCEEEDLVALLPDTYGDLGAISLALGDLDEAKKYASMFLETALRFNSEDSYRVETARALLRRVTKAEKKART
jgi:hypothetical protein